MVVIMIIGKLNLILCTSSYNSNDYLLAAYLIKKSNQIESIKMVDILKDTKVSKSTLLRFLKKLGYKNYTDVQYLITKEKKHQEIFKERIIEKNLRDITTSLFDAEVINTQSKKPNEIALYIGNKVQERNRGDNVYERE